MEMRIKMSLLLLPFLYLGCSDTGPPSTNRSSNEFTTLAEKVAFLNQYVSFDRNYDRLDFSITYHNNSAGMVPGPSDWDIRIVAQVPPVELTKWSSGMSRIDNPELGWAAGIPTAIDYSSVRNWFQGRGALVGIDEAHAVVLYRSTTM
jgi:hypothetical protein